MMFRRLYWVTEQETPKIGWRATGVYTSTADLIERGIRWVGDADGASARLRIVLVKLDSSNDVLGSWDGPEFAGLEAGLEPFQKTGEFTSDDCLNLRRALDSFVAALKA